MRRQVKRAGSYEFVQLRNPWGQDGEWEGPWSDSSRLWDVNPDVKQTLGFTSSNDGVFWMEFKDFIQHFSRISGVLRLPSFS